MQDAWRGYRDACYPDGASAIQNRETHQAFMAGALVAYLAIAECATKPDAEARAFIDARMQELIAFDNARRAAMKGRR